MSIENISSQITKILMRLDSTLHPFEIKMLNELNSSLLINESRVGDMQNQLEQKEAELQKAKEEIEADNRNAQDFIDTIHKLDTELQRYKSAVNHVISTVESGGDYDLMDLFVKLQDAVLVGK